MNTDQARDTPIFKIEGDPIERGDGSFAVVLSGPLDEWPVLGALSPFRHELDPRTQHCSRCGSSASDLNKHSVRWCTATHIGDTDAN